jgi:hypothetical protein
VPIPGLRREHYPQPASGAGRNLTKPRSITRPCSAQ